MKKIVLFVNWIIVGFFVLLFISLVRSNSNILNNPLFFFMALPFILTLIALHTNIFRGAIVLAKTGNILGFIMYSIMIIGPIMQNSYDAFENLIILTLQGTLPTCINLYYFFG